MYEGGLESQCEEQMNSDHITSDLNIFYDCIDDDEEVMECRNEGDQLHNNCADNMNGLCEDDNIEDNMENDDFFHLIDDTLIHPNLSCKTADAILMILEFFLHHHLTWVALSDLLQLFHSMLGSNSTLPKTKYFFQKFFGSNEQAIFHFYCQNCNLYIDTLTNLKQENHLDKCLNCQHEFSLKKMNNGHFFIQLPLRDQIYNKIVKHPEILDFGQTPELNNSIRDYYDGALYKDLRQKIGSCKLVTLTMNTDGVRVFKSTAKSSLWPIQMFINEFPATKRFKLGNIILNGVWFGKNPDVSLYLKHLINELNELDEDKIQVNIANKRHDVTVRAFLMTADTVARCKLMKMKQFNGKFGCTYCLHPGVRLDGAKTSKYPVSTTEYTRRTHASTLKLMKDFSNTGKDSSGVIGISPLIGIKDYDLIKGTVIDYMHCVLLGVVNLLLTLWFDSTNHFCNYYITPTRADIPIKNLMNIKPLKSFSHRPRSIEDRENWKANELRNWLLYYAMPCLKGTLKEIYLRHFSLLAEAIFIFLTTNISEKDFKKASENLKKFVDDFESLYGKENMTYNVHLVSHIAQCVKDCGPLWVYSNFNFESNNGSLVKNVMGTSDVAKQIITKYFYNVTLESLKEKNETARDYIDGIRSYNVKNSKKIGSITLFGKPTNIILNESEQIILNKTKVLDYKKLFFSNDVYYNTSYKKAQGTNDTVVSLKDGTVGQINRIYEDAGTVYILLQKFLVEAEPYFPIHLKKVEIADLEFVRADEISHKCILINMLKETFLSYRPNTFESD